MSDTEIKKPNFMTVREKKTEGMELPFRGFLVGFPGSGKSSAAAYIANNLKDDGLVIFIDANGESLAGVEMLLEPQGEARFIHIPIYPDNLDTKGSKAKLGSTTDQIIDTLSELEEQGFLNSKNTHVFVDGITDICNDLVRINHMKSAKTGEHDALRTFNFSQADYFIFHSRLVKATRNCSLWMIGHLKEVQIDGGKVQYGMNAITKPFSVQILTSEGISNLFVYERRIDKNGNTDFVVLTKPTQKMPFIKNTCATYEGVPAETDQKNFLAKFINCSRNKKWDDDSLTIT